MNKLLSGEGLDLIFRNARTHTVWLDQPVDDGLLRQVYDLAKMGPTSANMCPMRVVFVKSREAEQNSNRRWTRATSTKPWRPR